ncbi:uncharacterized protein FIBRA_06370 [Fibroporia radiculosa]|uniref:Small ribosomal subunit protein mS23 n=1 Tax=Fibroporia radiculosa TaxID=599839 RepID=J4H415_9APHY|nr:uncharacterized protein FIBRA_06370 [Fibroporia radiculosa]CCM04204.1 predicted protein [Fibroporia radiculosa]
MSRRIASQVHKQASRLLREGYLKKEPAWYQAVLSYPPLPLPPKAPPARSQYDLPPTPSSPASFTKSISQKARNRPAPVHYAEDTIRRQFFRDHPFEAFRATTLVEGAGIQEEHPIQGKEWTRLIQRGRNPMPEDAVRFAVNLHFSHGQPLTKAYLSAVSQFRSLRSEQQFASKFALLEAQHYGIEFGPSQVEIAFRKEEEALDSWAKSDEINAGENAARKRWKAIVEREGPPAPWTRGQDYVRLWQKGIRPTYAPLLTERKITPAGLTSAIPKTPYTKAELATKTADYLRVIPRSP